MRAEQAIANMYLLAFCVFLHMCGLDKTLKRETLGTFKDELR